MATVSFASDIDKEYEKDPRREILANALTAKQTAPMTPLAGGLQGLHTLVAALLHRKMLGDYGERKAAYSQGLQGALSGLGTDAGQKEIAQALIASGNPDLVAKGGDVWASSFTDKKAPTWSTKPWADEENNLFVSSSAGGAPQPLGIKGKPAKEELPLELRQKDLESKIGYRQSIMGMPPVIETNSGVFTYPKNDPTKITRLPGTGPSPAEAAAAQQAFQADQSNQRTDKTIRASVAEKERKRSIPNASQAKAGMLVGEADLANSTMLRLQKEGYNPASLKGGFDRAAAGKMTTNWLASPQGQQYTSAAREFVAAAGYGKSGANLTEGEWETGRATYIPEVLDSQEQLRFKESARAKAIQGMNIQAGPAAAPHQGGLMSGGLPKPKNAQERNALPSKTEYIAPDGTIMRTK